MPKAYIRAAVALLARVTFEAKTKVEGACAPSTFTTILVFVEDNAANVLSVAHVVVSLVDLIDLVFASNQFVELELLVLVHVKKNGHRHARRPSAVNVALDALLHHGEFEQVDTRKLLSVVAERVRDLTQSVAGWSRLPCANNSAMQASTLDPNPFVTGYSEKDCPPQQHPPSAGFGRGRATTVSLELARRQARKSRELCDVVGRQLAERRDSQQTHRASNLLAQDVNRAIDTRFTACH
jgi:hypothetical protein